MLSDRSSPRSTPPWPRTIHLRCAHLNSSKTLNVQPTIFLKTAVAELTGTERDNYSLRDRVIRDVTFGEIDPPDGTVLTLDYAWQLTLHHRMATGIVTKYVGPLPENSSVNEVKREAARQFTDLAGELALSIRNDENDVVDLADDEAIYVASNFGMVIHVNFREEIEFVWVGTGRKSVWRSGRVTKRVKFWRY
jgi:hypothetical protein